MSTQTENKLSDDVDISEFLSLEEQKECCEFMLDEILDAENMLNNRMASVQTINDVVQSQERLMNSLGEFLGYHYGRMSSSKIMISTVLVNLNRFLEGSLDETDHGARGMYLNLWYNLGIAKLTEFEECLADLESMEMDIIKTATGNGEDYIVLSETTLH